MRPARDWRLYLVTDRALSRGRPLEEVVAAAVRGGVTAVQLREKDASTRDFVALGRALRPLLAAAGIPLLVNDRVDVALAIGADGVHIGQQDLDYASARRLLGPQAAIGLSVETDEQARAAEAFDLDYIGVGPILATATKPDAAPPLGLDGLARVRTVSRHVIVAIGGVGPANARATLAAGADGLAVVSAICSADDVERAARDLRQIVDEAR